MLMTGNNWTVVPSKVPLLTVLGTFHFLTLRPMSATLVSVLNKEGKTICLVVMAFLLFSTIDNEMLCKLYVYTIQSIQLLIAVQRNRLFLVLDQ